MIAEKNVNNNFLPIKIDEKIIKEGFNQSKSSSKKVLGIVLATKPCFYKLWSLVHECRKKGVPYIIIHTGQHYDDLVGHGLVEFNFKKNLAVNLNIRGDLCQKSSEIFTKLKYLADYLNKNHPDILLIPYVNGDTLAAGIFPLAWLFATNTRSIQGEAGLRSMSPESFFNFKESQDFEEFTHKQFNGKWLLNRNEPFPEQIDTYISAASCEYLFAPVELNKEHLLREGYNEEHVYTSGNTVVDAIKYRRQIKPDKSIFETYPQLESGEWLRIDIHRRGNLTERRFKSIIGGITGLVKSKHNVILVELNATRKALEYYKLRKKLVQLNKEHKNFLFTPLWREYPHVVEFISSKNCWGILTDSGSMQEEMNELQKPCLTARFNTDRPETVMESHSNLLIPPVSSEFVEKMIKKIYKHFISDMSNKKRLYGIDVAPKIIKTIKNIFEKNNNFFTWAHESLDIYKEPQSKFKYL